MYKPSLLFDRTAEERSDPFKSWARSDQAFFAAGACHILADLFCQLHQDEPFYMVYLKPKKGFPGNHVYATNSTWAFDHNGWTKEATLLSVTEKAYQKRYPGWSYTRVVIRNGLEDFCRQNHHRLPWQFAYLPWERAYTYIQRFSPVPPDTSI